MSDLQEFALTDEHLTLLRHMNVDWNDLEFGAPSIDPKRPYGNGDVAGDIGRILGFEVYNADGDPLTEAYNRACNLHDETATALQVVLAAGVFEPGEYVADPYKRNWRPHPEGTGR